MRGIPRLGLTGILVLFCIGVVIVVWGTTLPTLLLLSKGVTERQNAEVLRGRGQVASTQLARVLYGEWFKLQALATAIANGESQDALRMQFDTVKATNTDSAWIGFADTSGKVVVASGRILEGDSVLERPWFRAGTQGPFAGDKHEALLLARFVTSKSGEPLRLIDLSMPVRREDQSLAGVIGMHIDWYWVRDFLRTFSRDGIDLLLVSRQGDVLAGPRDLVGTRESLHSTVAAGQGAKITAAETWSDGQRYLVTVVPITSYLDLPSFGWSLIVRQRADAAFAPANTVLTWALPIMVAVSIGVAFLGLIMGRVLGQPVARLAASASDIAHGRFTAPVPDERRYREVAVLASALARLQSVAGSDDGPPASTQTKTAGIPAR